MITCQLFAVIEKAMNLELKKNLEFGVISFPVKAIFKKIYEWRQCMLYMLHKLLGLLFVV